MGFSGLDIQVFLSVAVILGCAFIALLCDYYKGINERLREQALELAVRLEAQSRANAIRAAAPAPSPDLSVILAAITRVGQTLEHAMRTSLREEVAMQRVAPTVAETLAEVHAEAAAAFEPEPVFEPVSLAAPVVEDRLSSLVENIPAEIKEPTTSFAWSERPLETPETPEIDLLPLEVPNVTVPAVAEAPAPVEAAPPPPPPPPAPTVQAPSAPSVVKIRVLRTNHAEAAPTLIAPITEETPVASLEAPPELLLPELPPVASAPPPPPPPPPPVLIEPEPPVFVAEPPVLLEEQPASLAEPTTVAELVALAEATAKASVFTLPKGFVDRATYAELQDHPGGFTGLVVSIGINEYERMSQSQGAAAVEKLVSDVERLAGSLISTLNGIEHFACRAADDEFILAFENESGPSAQRRLSNLSERLWDFQLRSLGNYSVVFSWGATEAYGERFAEATASASERMRETRMNRRSSGTGAERPRLKKVVNA